MVLHQQTDFPFRSSRPVLYAKDGKQSGANDYSGFFQAQESKNTLIYCLSSKKDYSVHGGSTTTSAEQDTQTIVALLIQEKLDKRRDRIRSLRLCDSIERSKILDLKGQSRRDHVLGFLGESCP